MTDLADAFAATVIETFEFDESKVTRDAHGRFGDKDGGDDPVRAEAAAANASRVHEALGGRVTDVDPRRAEFKAEVQAALGPRLAGMVNERPALRAEFDRAMAYPTTHRGVDPTNRSESTVGRDLQVRDAYERINAAADRGEPDAIATLAEKPLLDNPEGALDWAERNGGLGKMEDLWAADTSRRYVDTWASSAAGTSPMSLAMQVAAADEFGIRSESFDRYMSGNAPGGWSLQESADSTLDYERESMKAFARVEYDETQSWFAKQGLSPDDEITVHRGMRFGDTADGDYPEVPAGFPTEGSSKVKVDLNPVSSWTVSEDVARLPMFSGSKDARERGRDNVTGERIDKVTGSRGFVLTDTVKVSDVMSTYRTGRGAAHEAEIRVINRPGREVTVAPTEKMRTY